MKKHAAINKGRTATKNEQLMKCEQQSLPSEAFFTLCIPHRGASGHIGVSTAQDMRYHFIGVRQAAGFWCGLATPPQGLVNVHQSQECATV